MEIIIRPTEPGDIGWLIGMHGKIYSRQYRFDSGFEIDIARKTAGFFEKTNNFNRIYIAQVNNEPAGSIAISLKREDISFVNFLLVTESYRGNGIAEKLLEKVINRSRGKAVKKIHLETYSCLVEARTLYKKYGFCCYTKNSDIKKFGQVFDQEFWELKLQI